MKFNFIFLVFATLVLDSLSTQAGILKKVYQISTGITVTEEGSEWPLYEQGIQSKDGRFGYLPDPNSFAYYDLNESNQDGTKGVEKRCYNDFEFKVDKVQGYFSGGSIEYITHDGFKLTVGTDASTLYCTLSKPYGEGVVPLPSVEVLPRHASQDNYLKQAEGLVKSLVENQVNPAIISHLKGKLGLGIDFQLSTPARSNLIQELEDTRKMLKMAESQVEKYKTLIEKLNQAIATLDGNVKILDSSSKSN